jgi:hypothetical protein
MILQKVASSVADPVAQKLFCDSYLFFRPRSIHTDCYLFLSSSK